jgi:hypothetical protein
MILGVFCSQRNSAATGEPMRALSHAELTTIDLHSELRFSVDRHVGWLDLIAGPVILFVLLDFAWIHPSSWAHALIQKSAWPLVFSLPGFLALAVGWMRGRSTELRVTSSELVATGNVGRLFSSEVRVPASEVKSIGFKAGGHGRQGGLYVKRGWRSICLLPGLNPKQAGAVGRTIFRRFPEIGPEDHNPDSLLFGIESDFTALGLSSPQHKGGGPEY